MNIKEKLFEMNEDYSADVLEDFDDAVIGITQLGGGYVPVYSYDKMVDVALNCEDLEIDNYEEAADYVSYGICKFSGYMNLIIMDSLMEEL